MLPLPRFFSWSLFLKNRLQLSLVNSLFAVFFALATAFIGIGCGNVFDPYKPDPALLDVAPPGYTRVKLLAQRSPSNLALQNSRAFSTVTNYNGGFLINFTGINGTQRRLSIYIDPTSDPNPVRNIPNGEYQVTTVGYADTSWTEAGCGIAANTLTLTGSSTTVDINVSGTQCSNQLFTDTSASPPYNAKTLVVRLCNTTDYSSTDNAFNSIDTMAYSSVSSAECSTFNGTGYSIRFSYQEFHTPDSTILPFLDGQALSKCIDISGSGDSISIPSAPIGSIRSIDSPLVVSVSVFKSAGCTGPNRQFILNEGLAGTKGSGKSAVIVGTTTGTPKVSALSDASTSDFGLYLRMQPLP